MKKNSERGSGKPGCLFTLLVVAAVIFLSIKIIPVFIAKVNFEDDLTSITSKAGVYSWSERAIIKEINTAAEAYGFETSKEGIEINRRNKFQQTPRIIILVKYSKTVEFPGYTHIFKFESTTTGLIGRL